MAVSQLIGLGVAVPVDRYGTPKSELPTFNTTDHVKIFSREQFMDLRAFEYSRFYQPFKLHLLSEIQVLESFCRHKGITAKPSIDTFINTFKYHLFDRPLFVNGEEQKIGPETLTEFREKMYGEARLEFHSLICILQKKSVISGEQKRAIENFIESIATCSGGIEYTLAVARYAFDESRHTLEEVLRMARVEVIRQAAIEHLSQVVNHQTYYKGNHRHHVNRLSNSVATQYDIPFCKDKSMDSGFKHEYLRGFVDRASKAVTLGNVLAYLTKNYFDKFCDLMEAHNIHRHSIEEIFTEELTPNVHAELDEKVFYAISGCTRDEGISSAIFFSSFDAWTLEGIEAKLKSLVKDNSYLDSRQTISIFMGYIERCLRANVSFRRYDFFCTEDISGQEVMRSVEQEISKPIEALAENGYNASELLTSDDISRLSFSQLKLNISRAITCGFIRHKIEGLHRLDIDLPLRVSGGSRELKIFLKGVFSCGCFWVEDESTTRAVTLGDIVGVDFSEERRLNEILTLFQHAAENTYAAKDFYEFITRNLLSIAYQSRIKNQALVIIQDQIKEKPHILPIVQKFTEREPSSYRVRELHAGLNLKEQINNGEIERKLMNRINLSARDQAICGEQILSLSAALYLHKQTPANLHFLFKLLLDLLNKQSVGADFVMQRLQLIIENNDFLMVKSFKYKTKVQGNEMSLNIFELAIVSGWESIYKLLPEQRYNWVDSASDGVGTMRVFPIHLSIFCADAVSYFFLTEECGVNLNSQDSDGNSIAHYIFQNKDIAEVIKQFILHSEKVDFGLKNKEGVTPFQLAEQAEPQFFGILKDNLERRRRAIPEPRHPPVARRTQYDHIVVCPPNVSAFTNRGKLVI
ncbi:ankyrin repeat domain-containing protein [Parashewanella curva]|uniref:Ankyrin repeat domain-containing protein n=1 Tax=Parashewanella curva TaxID=2338552 RepID=A0A3L8Q386_9GAMM|nr:ankyrin repeat domain-containing protein [Parashewanella curva]RLV61082.1 ankyrin repeat domain-containing protein [Parashewanella curva]